MSAAASTHRTLAAALLAGALILALVGPAGSAPPPRDDEPPSSPANVRVTNATASSVAIEWSEATDNVGVSAYELSGELRRNRINETRYSADRLDCGQSLRISVAAIDRAGNQSVPAPLTIATAPCVDTSPPTAPSGFRQSATSQNAVVLAWDASSDDKGVVGYAIYRLGVPVATTSEPTATIAALSCGSTYEVAVDAYDAAGNRSQRRSAWIQTAACTTQPPPPHSDTTAPSQPTSLSVSASTQTSITLAWGAATDNVGVAGYGIYRNSALVSSAPQPGATLTGLACGTTYTLQVDAYDAAGNRSSKASAVGSTAACSGPPPPPPSDTTPPSQPTSLAVSASTQTSVTLGWTAATDNVGVTSYGVYRNNTLVTSVSQPGASLASLSCGTAYAFAVDAVDAAGNRSSKASVTGTTAPCLDTQAPTPPSSVQATSRTTTSIALSWSASTDNVGVTGYGLYRGSSLVGSATTTSGIFSGLTCNTNYTLAVDASDAAGNRSTKTTVMVATTACPDTTPPSTPTGLAVSNVSQTGASLAWTASTDNVGVAGYDVYLASSKVASTTGTSHGFSGLSCGTSYTLGVESFDAAGTRSSRATASTSTSACSTPPTPPSSVAYPASYFTGPLGNRNPLPSKQGAFLIERPGSEGCDWNCIKGRVAKHEQATGRRFDGIANQWRPHEVDRVEQWVHDRGSLPIVDWNPGGSMQDVASGARDAAIRDFANWFKQYSFISMVRMFHEFDLQGWSHHSCGETFIDGWRRVVDIFKQQGVTNVGFWWSPTEGADRSCIASSYPGDAYVDWAGTGWYNWCYVSETNSCWSSPLHGGWATFPEIFDYSISGLSNQHDQWGPRKPIVIGETMTVYDGSHPARKAEWFQGVVPALKNMQHATGVMFFDADVRSTDGPKANFEVDYPTSVPAVYEAYVQMARDPYLNTRS